MAISLFVPCVYAADAKVSIALSSSTVKEGGKVTVTVTVKTDGAIGAYSLNVGYDSSVIEYTDGAGSGSGGTVKIAGYGDGSVKKLSAKLTFKAVGSGSTSVKTSGGEVYDWGENSLKISHASAKVSVGSGVTTTEATTEAKTTTEATTEKQTTEATTEATTEKATTEAPTTTEAQTTTEEKTTEATTEASTEASTEEETTEAAVAVQVTIDGKTYTFPEELDDIEIPMGFDPVTMEYKGTMVNAFSGPNGSFTIVCLKDQDGNYKWFIYEGGDKFISYVEIDKSNDTLYVIKPDDSVVIPEGYKSLELMMGEDILPCFTMDEDSEVVLVYAKKQSGETGFYLYDTVERGFIRCFEPDTSEEVTEAVTEEEKKEEPEKKGMGNLPIMILCFILGFVPGIALYLTKKTEDKKDDSEEDVKELSREEALDKALGTGEDKDKKDKKKSEKTDEKKDERPREIKLPIPEDKKVKNEYVEKEKKKKEELEDKAAKLVSKLELDKSPTGPVPVIELPDEKPEKKDAVDSKEKPADKNSDKTEEKTADNNSTKTEEKTADNNSTKTEEKATDKNGEKTEEKTDVKDSEKAKEKTADKENKEKDDQKDTDKKDKKD